MNANEIEQAIEAEVSKRVAAQLVAQQPPEVRIVIGHRGWVWVCRYEEVGDEIVLHGARCIRRWGTTAGLAELRYGPLESTILDAPSTVRLHKLGKVADIEADEASWAEALNGR